jgi:hypothetical protein
MKSNFLILVDPRLIKIGFWGKVIFDELLRIDRDFGFDGTIPKAFTTPDYLQWRLNLKPSDIDGDEDGRTPRKLIKEQLAMLSWHCCTADIDGCTVLYVKDGQ